MRASRILLVDSPTGNSYRRRKMHFFSVISNIPDWGWVVLLVILTALIMLWVVLDD